MKLVVAVDKNWAIGYKGELLVSIPADHKAFRQETTGKVVVLGKQPLKNRVNIILSRDESYTVKDALVVHSVEELLEETQKYDPDDVYIIGGASVYEQMLPYCDTAYVTCIDEAFPADTWFPNLEEDESWTCADESEVQEHEGLTFRFRKYVRV